MPNKTVKIRRRPRISQNVLRKTPLRYRIKGNRGVTRGLKHGHRRGYSRRHANVIHSWVNNRAKPWIGRGRAKRQKFMKEFYQGFKKVIKPFANIGGPVLDALGMPEFGIPLSLVGGVM